MTRLWFEGRIVFDRAGPAYRIGEDAEDRVTYAARPIATELRFLRHLLALPWFENLSLERRRSACVKFVRIHLFGAVHNRPDPSFWTDKERRSLAKVARKLLIAAPGAESVLSLADRRLLDAILAPDTEPATLIGLARARRRHGRPDTLITRDLAQLLATEAPLRLMAASVLLR
ncbi:hypothetical protein [Occultella kanbiaonis]|uniref:hypothetical protein n=1 Tax=Occultella kanbiaonis TaxID=2675754 RepID=UPI0012BA2250|nr:hypothetical protein [Occultella kanbiaonis]